MTQVLMSVGWGILAVIAGAVAMRYGLPSFGAIREAASRRVIDALIVVDRKDE